MPPEEIEHLPSRRPQRFSVWAENAEALALFLACSSQWRLHFVAGLSGGATIWQGLDYTALEAAARLRGMEMTPACFADVQLLEAAARDVLNEK